MSKEFSKIIDIEVPTSVTATNGRNESFTISFSADGPIPFPQVILRSAGAEKLFNRGDIRRDGPRYRLDVPAGLFFPGELNIQIEGCTKSDIEHSSGSDWIKVFAKTTIKGPDIKILREGLASGGKNKDEAKIYFSIHKHMHQPYYNAMDTSYWDGEKDSIFGSRGGPYTHFLPAAVRQYVGGGLPHGGLSTSWSGSLIEQLNRASKEGLCGGCFKNWNAGLREIAQAKTSLGNPRMDFVAFGFFHPLMALIPHRDILKQIDWHRRVIRETFGVEASTVMFPPETAFHVRMIPALCDAGVKAVIYDSIHRYRTCKGYPYGGVQEGMLPPNRAEQENEAVSDWLQLQNVWAGSKISPSLLKPEYVRYEDANGKTYKMIAVPAERYIGNEDARGGFGALQYPDVLNQLRMRIIETGSYDPKHPPFLVLHSDGDNHGGGADSYYTSNTGALVEWLNRDPRFELIAIRDYLELFPPDTSRAVHIEPGSWSGADNGDPQFKKWFSRYTESYSPDLNSWAVLTALQNVMHSLEDAQLTGRSHAEAERLLLTAETSCYWYWTGQTVWDSQVTNAANRALELIRTEFDGLVSSGKDTTGPTIFPPWIIPENPGGKTWGNNCLRDADKQGRVYTFIHDISGLKRVRLVIRQGGNEKSLEMKDLGPYSSQTGAKLSARQFTAELPAGLGDIRYFIEAEDSRGNVSRSSLERVCLE